MAQGPRRTRLGSSVEGRPIWVHEIGAPSARRRLLVVGGIHGNERAGVTLARRLELAAPPPGIDLWVIDDLNPDGRTMGTRQNARGVDLNRNFPYRWHRGGRRGDQQFPGSAPLSEPESRIAHRLILRLRPSVTIWLHQPLGVVDLSGGSSGVERRFARSSGLALARLMRYPGSAVGWQNHVLSGTTAFVVELPPGRLGPAQAGRISRALLHAG